MEDKSLYILMEYAESGDLYRLLKGQKKKKKYFSEKDLWMFAYEIMLGIEYLHKRSVVHRDIKTLNIFIGYNKRIKVGDMGVSKIVSSVHALQGTRVGTPLYLSPELIKHQAYDFKIDIWAVGCALYHLATFEPPFQGDNLISLGNNIVHKKPKPIPNCYSARFSAFIDKMLQKSPKLRPSAKEALKMFPSFIPKSYTPVIAFPSSDIPVVVKGE